MPQHDRRGGQQLLPEVEFGQHITLQGRVVKVSNARIAPSDAVSLGFIVMQPSCSDHQLVSIQSGLPDSHHTSHDHAVIINYSAYSLACQTHTIRHMTWNIASIPLFLSYSLINTPAILMRSAPPSHTHQALSDFAAPVFNWGATQVHFTFTYNGQDEHPVREHEIPAVFLTRALGKLTVYTGNAPWTGAACQQTVPGFPNK